MRAPLINQLVYIFVNTLQFANFFERFLRFPPLTGESGWMETN